MSKDAGWALYPEWMQESARLMEANGHDYRGSEREFTLLLTPELFDTLREVLATALSGAVAGLQDAKRGVGKGALEPIGVWQDRIRRTRAVIERLESATSRAIGE